MFSARVLVRAAVRSSAAARFSSSSTVSINSAASIARLSGHSSRNDESWSSTRKIGAAAAGAVAAALLAYNSLRNENTVSCSPAAAPAPAQMTLGSYEVASFRLSDLTPEQIASMSLEQLAKRYGSQGGWGTFLHGLVWGAPPPPESALPALSLLFTASDPDPFHRHCELLVRSIQDRICTDLIDVERFAADRELGSAGAPATLLSIDGSPVNDKLRELLLSQSSTAAVFPERIFIRPGAIGGGIERVISGGRVFSKAGINVTVSHAPNAPKKSFERLKEDHPSLKNIKTPDAFELFTASVSLVLHPVNPHAPTCHANYRFFDLTFPPAADDPLQQPIRVSWFGGGSDLTPTYVVAKDAQHFHRTLRETLNPLDSTLYPQWKSQCDAYFNVKHRDNERRGVGGIFFDDEHTRSKDQYEKIIRALGMNFSKGYFPIVLKSCTQKFTEDELAYQQLRRGRYVEFNLCYDKGTSYGLLQPAARIDAILMSLPAVARFAYRRPNKDQREAETVEVLKNPKDW